ncbi:hypothetical protein [Leptospira sp. GIMC2001]|uniref:hypothetical protein n=1 Tax=Leptospira sp. GIMC2001 TaxID=1513297 RepID=UPI00234B7B84|nr:hypothetical protein [Leptospira sp. GIMC2001]WCL50250.1 hypothetical protein O4O04_05360 [Leptospira sp. GIMC2001]
MNKLKISKLFFFGLIILSFLWAELSFNFQDFDSNSAELEFCSETNQTVQFFLLEPNINEESETHSSYSDDFISLANNLRINNLAFNIQTFDFRLYSFGNSLLIYSLGSRAPPIS